MPLLTAAELSCWGPAGHPVLPCSSEGISSLKRRGQGLQVSPACHVGPGACFPSSLWSLRGGQCGYGVMSVSSSVKEQEPALAIYTKGFTRWTYGGSDHLHGAGGTGSEGEQEPQVPEAEPQTAMGRRPPPGTASTVAPSQTCSVGTWLQPQVRFEACVWGQR